MKNKNYWIDRFSGEPAKSTFPYDKTRETGTDKEQYRGGVFSFDFSPALARRLIKMSGGSLPRLQMILTAGVIGLLYKYAGTDDIITGTSIYKQEVEAEFINTVLPLRSRVSGAMTFKDLLLQVRETITGAVKNQNYSMEKLLQELGISYSIDDDFPLFDVVVLLENIQEKTFIEHVSPNFGCYFQQSGDAVTCRLEYNALLYEPGTVEQIATHLQNMMQQAVFNVDLEMAAIDILGELEKKEMLLEFNNTGVPIDGSLTIPRLFAAQVEKNPGRVAVRDGRKQVTFHALWQRAEQVAGFLEKEGLSRGDIVCIISGRSLELITAILAVQLAGAVYLPIDPGTPVNRIEFILKDSSARVCLFPGQLPLETQAALQRVTTGFAISLDRLDEPGVLPGSDSQDGSHISASLPGDAAYIIYTSGTTGLPKGVMVSHRSIVNYILWAIRQYSAGEPLDLPFYSSIAFDLTLTSIFVPLLSGGTLDVYGEVEMYKVMDDIIRRDRVGAVKLTPSHLKIIQATAPHQVSNLKCFIVGGEELESQLAAEINRDFGAKVEIFNEYGPTEATVGCMIHRYERLDDKLRTVPIGKPIDNTAIFILDKYLQPVPSLVQGELYIGGDGLALGYINRPELTNEKFARCPGTLLESRSQSTNPAATRPHMTLYKSGDLARRLPGGNIEFLGRIDHQVKIRGFRVELGEIESRLLSHKAVKEAVVLAKEANDKEKYLCAYIVASGPVPDAGQDAGIETAGMPGIAGDSPLGRELREYLAEDCPNYMIPAFYVILDRIPLTNAGKIDYTALPSPGIFSGYTAPRTPLEKKLAAIWADILEKPIAEIGIDTNFFEIGGHSLNAILMITRLQKELEVELSLADVFNSPSIRQLAIVLKKSSRVIFENIEPVEKKEYYALSSAQKRMYVAQQMDPQGTSYNVPQFNLLEGELDKEKLETVFKELLNRHDSLRTYFARVEEQPVQRILEPRDVDFKITGEPGPVSSFIRPFDLSQPLLFRVGLAEETPGKHILMVDMHHIITDGFSMNLLIEDFLTLYGGGQLPPLKLQYKDFSEWQNRTLFKENLAKQEAYWLNKFEGDVPQLNIPTDYPRPPIRHIEKGGIAGTRLDQEASARVSNMVKTSGTTFFIFMLTLFDILLFKYTGQEDIVVGTPIAGRSHADLEKVIGVFLNMLGLRTCPSAAKTFEGFLKEVEEISYEAFDNQDYPFDTLVNKLGVQASLNRNPLFDTEFVAHSDAGTGTGMQALRVKPYQTGVKFAKFDLQLVVVEKKSSLDVALRYSTELYTHASAEKIVADYLEIMKQVIDQPTITLEDISLARDSSPALTKSSIEEQDDFNF